jgi:prophage tail gpP-like protein
MINEFTLIVNKWKVLTNWKSIRITQSMDNLCGSISLKTAMFNPQDPLIEGVFLENEYLALINGQLVGNGYIEKIPVAYNATSMSIDFAGRDKLCDIVDCHVDRTLEAKSVTPEFWFTKLISPFGINLVIDKTAIKEMKTKIPGKGVSAEVGETILEAILKVCHQIGVMPISMGDGNLTITKGPSKIVVGKLSSDMVLEARFNQSNTDRFGEYICIGGDNGGDEKSKPEDWMKIGAHFNDDKIQRHRPYVIIEDRSTNAASCMTRALFERNYRAGHSRSLEYVVEGWTKPISQVNWKINEEIMVLDYNLFIFRPLLISEVVFTYSQGSGFKTKLKLVHPSTYAANIDIDKYNTLSDGTAGDSVVERKTPGASRFNTSRINVVMPRFINRGGSLTRGGR